VKKIEYIKSYFEKSTLWIKSMLHRKQSLPKVPRKKVEIQLQTIEGQFLAQVELLKQSLNTVDMYPITRDAGKRLLNDITEFLKFDLTKANINRIKQSTETMLDSSDLVLWLIHRLQGFYEDIHIFLNTARR